MRIISRPVVDPEHKIDLMRLAATPPAVVKFPPAIRSPLGMTTSEYTKPCSMPVPRGDQVAPFQRAIRVASTSL